MMEQEQTNNKKVYFRIIAIIVAIVAVFLGFKGYQWYQKDYYKTLLQKEFNRKYELRERGSFCYEVGKVQLPYIDQGYPPEFIQQYKLVTEDQSQFYNFPNYRKDDDKYRLTQLLPTFYELGLLSRKLVEGTNYYQYDVTEEGKKYQAEYDGNLVFCYGKSKVLEVTDITKRDSFTYKGKTDVIVIYNYELDAEPNWVMNDGVISLYGVAGGKIRTGREVFIEKNGNIFIDGDFDYHIYTPRVTYPD